MRPWTTRTTTALVLAAGFAAAGTVSASAAPETHTGGIAEPDLSAVDNDISFVIPANTCTGQALSESGMKAPCADAQLDFGAPNVFKKVGLDIVETTHGIAGELQDGEPPLAPGKANSVLGHVFTEAARLSEMTKTRPSIAAEVKPDNIGTLTEHSDDAAVLEAAAGPLPEHHQGTSVADTALSATVLQGLEAKPITNPLRELTPVLNNNPLQTSQSPVKLAKPSEALPLARDLPVVSQLDQPLDPTALVTSAQD